MRAVVLRYSGERVVHLLNIPTTQYPHYSIASHSCVTGKNCILELFVSSDDRTVTYQ